MSTTPGKVSTTKSHVKEFACGGGAAIINIMITFPPHKLMFRQQLYGYSALEAFKSMQNEGVSKLYRGVKPPMIQAVISKSLMFGLFNFYDQHLIPHLCPSMSSGWNQASAAFLSGTTEAILTPFERAQTLLQIPAYNKSISGAVDAVKYINKLGLSEHYRGLSAILMRNGPTSVCFFGLREPLREALHVGHTTSELLMSDFICGAMLGACLNTLFFPINVARSKMQSFVGQEFISVPKALSLVYHERGGKFHRVYRGVQINFIRSLVSWGVINTSYELLRRHT